MSNSNTPAGLSIQMSLVEKDSGTTAFLGSFSLRTELQPLVATKLRSLASFAMKYAMIKDIEGTLSEVIVMGFIATDKVLQNDIFCFIEMA